MRNIPVINPENPLPLEVEEETEFLKDGDIITFGSEESPNYGTTENGVSFQIPPKQRFRVVVKNR